MGLGSGGAVARAWDGRGGDTLAREVYGEGEDAPHEAGDDGDEQSVLLRVRVRVRVRVRAPSLARPTMWSILPIQTSL